VKDFVPAPTVEEVLDRVREAMGAVDKAAANGETATDPRKEPQLCRDYDGPIYILIDDEGEPCSDYNTDLDVLRAIRAGDPKLADCRIVMGGYRVFVEEPEIVDDPKASEYGREVPYTI